MASRTKLTTKGFEQYLERLAQAGRDIDQVSDEALIQGGEILLNGMKTRVPKGETHNLEKSLKVDGPHQDGNFHFVEVGVIDASADVSRYGNAQEFGTANMAAQPYIRPTLDGDMTKTRAEMKKVFVAAEIGIER